MTDLVQLVLDEHRIDGKRLGRHVEHDPRSRDHAFAAAAPMPIQSVLWPRTGAPFNQGDLGSCTGNATAGCVNTKPLHKVGRTLHEPDAVRIYSLATTLDSIGGAYPPDDTGSSGLAAAKAAQRLGLVGSYQHAFDLMAALQALMHGPVITGVTWYEGFDSPDPHGLVAIAGQPRGGHEFQVRGLQTGRDLVGYLDALVIAENSWGASWAEKGIFHFTVATWKQLLAEQGDVTVLLP